MTQPVLIVAHGQPGDPEPQQRAIEELAAKVARLLPGQEVRGATLAAKGALEGAWLPGALVYPLFMAGGWFTKVELPRRLKATGAIDARILAPFGEDPALTALALTMLRDTAEAREWALLDVALLVAGHGSGRSRVPAEATQAFAATLRDQVAQVTCGFIEEAPRIADAARGLGPRAICLPFFATPAGHVIEDLPEALAEADFQGVPLPPIGTHPKVPGLIAAAVSQGG